MGCPTFTPDYALTTGLGTCALARCYQGRVNAVERRAFWNNAVPPLDLQQSLLQAYANQCLKKPLGITLATFVAGMVLSMYCAWDGLLSKLNLDILSSNVDRYFGVAGTSVFWSMFWPAVASLGLLAVWTTATLLFRYFLEQEGRNQHHVRRFLHGAARIQFALQEARIEALGVDELQTKVSRFLSRNYEHLAGIQAALTLKMARPQDQAVCQEVAQMQKLFTEFGLLPEPKQAEVSSQLPAQAGKA